MIFFIWKGSSAVYIELDGLGILIDPASLFSANDIASLGGDLKVVLYTHEHSDHFDPSSLGELLSEFDATVVCNPGVHRVLKRRYGERLLRIKDGEMVEVNGITVHALRAVHPGYHPVVLLLEVGGISIFHGDGTGFSRNFQAFSPVDLAFIPVGFPSPNSSPSEALRIARALVPRVAVPFHGTDDEIAEFSGKIKLAKLDIEIITPRFGEEVNLTL